jgi:hypothetical protein
MTIVAGQWYDWKVVYDRTTGKIEVYQNNIYIGSWTDTTPLSNGNAVSFRSGNSNWQIDNFKVYRSRFSNQPLTVSVGNCASCELRFQNSNPVTPAGRIKSIVRDSANNLSSVAYYDVNVDWTAPAAVDTVNDGSGTDIDLSLSPTLLEGNWTSSSDPNSGFAAFWYAIGTNPGDSNSVAWTSNWGFDTVAISNLNLQTNQWYYLSVRAENGAGLLSTTSVSDGVLIDLTTGITTTSGGLSAGVYPNPISLYSVLFMNFNQAETAKISITDASGRIVSQEQKNYTAGTHSLLLYPLLHKEAKGVYFITITSDEGQVKLKAIVSE